MGYSWDIHRVFMGYTYVSGMCRVCIGYVSGMCRKKWDASGVFDKRVDSWDSLDLCRRARRILSSCSPNGSRNLNKSYIQGAPQVIATGTSSKWACKMKLAHEFGLPPFLLSPKIKNFG